MSSLEEFRLELVREYGFVAWRPTPQQLVAIAHGIVDLETRGLNVDHNSVFEVVTSHATTGLSIANEGLDDSDLKTLLLLATKVKRG